MEYESQNINHRSQAVVLFDAYPHEVQGGTKTAERTRRSRKHNVWGHNETNMTADENFLANQKIRAGWYLCTLQSSP